MQLVTSTIVVRGRGGKYYTKFKYWFVPEETMDTSVTNRKIPEKTEISLWGKDADEVRIKHKEFIKGLNMSRNTLTGGKNDNNELEL